MHKLNVYLQLAVMVHDVNTRMYLKSDFNNKIKSEDQEAFRDLLSHMAMFQHSFRQSVCFWIYIAALNDNHILITARVHLPPINGFLWAYRCARSILK
jgi:hypothetical protein